MKNNLSNGKVKIPKQEWKIAYLAGLIDGEGTVNLYKNKDAFEKWRPHFFITNNSEKLISWLKNTFGGVVIKHGNGYRWGLWAVKDVLTITELIIPLLTIKKEDAEKVKTYCERNINAHLL